MLARCETAEIRPSEAVALCDWCDGAPGLTPAEHDNMVRLKGFALRKASGARSGRSVEDIRDERKEETVRSQFTAPETVSSGVKW